MKRLPTMKQLQYLVALADTRHFGRAAERCHITQSTLSAGIRDLESVLGTAVAERSNRHVLITRIGEQITERAKALLRDAEDSASLHRICGRAQGRLAGPGGHGDLALRPALPSQPRSGDDVQRRGPPE